MAILAGGSVAARRVRPTAVPVVTIAGRLFVTWDTGDDVALLPAAAIAIYTVARHGDRRTGLITASIGAIIVSVARFLTKKSSTDVHTSAR